MIPANMLKFYINGAWVDPISTTRMGVENPATEEIVCEVAMGNAADADRAIIAARAAFDGWTYTPVAERIALMKRVLEEANDGPKHLYISLDIDVLDPGFAPATGTPEPGGFATIDLLRIVRALVLERPAEGLTPAGLLVLCKDLPHDWQLQRTVLGLETR
ncbi:MAG: aldehyde dehydrogenase family protein [Akkermansiaceae bacterium]|nr:aldehyde dehydrogenase family protein [Akkermansiaceae bacterium]